MLNRRGQKLGDLELLSELIIKLPLSEDSQALASSALFPQLPLFQRTLCSLTQLCYIVIQRLGV